MPVMGLAVTVDAMSLRHSGTGFLIASALIMSGCAGQVGQATDSSIGAGSSTATQPVTSTRVVPNTSEGDLGERGSRSNLAVAIAEQISSGNTECPESQGIQFEACLIFQGALYAWLGSALTPQDALAAPSSDEFRTLYAVAVANATPVLSSTTSYGFQREVLAEVFVKPGSDADVCLSVRYGICGNQSAIGKALFDAAEIPARFVSFYFPNSVTGLRNSHVAVEVEIGGVFRFIDTTYGAYWPIEGGLRQGLLTVDEIRNLPDPGGLAVWNEALLPWTALDDYAPFDHLTEEADILHAGVGTISLEFSTGTGTEDLMHLPSYVGDNQPDGRVAGVDFAIDAVPSDYSIRVDIRASRYGDSINSLCINSQCLPFPSDAGLLEFVVTDPQRLYVQSDDDVSYVVINSLQWTKLTG